MNSIALAPFSSSFSILNFPNSTSSSATTASFCPPFKLPPAISASARNKLFKFKRAESLPVLALAPIWRTISAPPTRLGGVFQDPGVDVIVRCQRSGVLQSGGLGLALLSVTSTAKVRISPFLSTLAANPTFVSGLFACFCAQSIKVLLNFFVERKWDLRILFASGGMPSSHSALCTALTTSVAICHGVADSLFPVCLGFSLIVMYDAIGVRRHAGMQAEVLNKIIEDLFQGHPISERKLKELLGHTPSQVVAGAVLGILVACFCCQGCMVSV